MIKPIRLYTDPILNKPCEPVIDFSTLEQLSKDMIETMHSYRGIGLAANQIGVNKNIFVCWLENKTNEVIFVNPKILCYTKEESIEKEGCLSIPGINILMKRSLGVEVEYQNILGETQRVQLTEFDARIFLHEFSHISGSGIWTGKI